MGIPSDSIRSDFALVKRTTAELHKSWRLGEENAIFRDFIERERNSVLKEYSSGMTEGPVPIVAALQQHDGFDVVRQFLIEENIYRPMESGAFAGEDGRTLLDEAIAWWARQLDEVDLRTVPSTDSQTVIVGGDADETNRRIRR